MEKKYISRSWFYVSVAVILTTAISSYTELELKKLDNKAIETKALSEKPASDLKLNSQDLIPKLFIIPSGPEREENPRMIPKISPQNWKTKEYDFTVTSIRPAF
jgi:hypothetical protein